MRPFEVKDKNIRDKFIPKETQECDFCGNDTRHYHLVVVHVRHKDFSEADLMKVWCKWCLKDEQQKFRKKEHYRKVFGNKKHESAEETARKICKDV